MPLRKLIPYCVSALLAIGAGSSYWIYHEVTSQPAYEPLPLTAELIPLMSVEGQGLIQDNPYLADYHALRKYFESQLRPAWCGVASSVTVLNALAEQPRYSQNGFFSEATASVRSEWQVTLGGMNLDELAGLLRAHGVDARAIHASEITIDKFRQTAMSNLATPGDYLLVNYSREPLGQGAYGHISPIAAYDLETDRFLVLDVTTYHYPPVWVETTTLWRALETMDSSSGLSRGFVEVRHLLPDKAL